MTTFADLLDSVDAALPGSVHAAGRRQLRSRGDRGLLHRRERDPSSDELVLRRISNPGTATPDDLRQHRPSRCRRRASPSTFPTSGGATPLDALDDRLFAAADPQRPSLDRAQHRGEQLRRGRIVEQRRAQRQPLVRAAESAAPTPSLVQAGTVFDSAGSNPLSYLDPVRHGLRPGTRGHGRQRRGGGVARRRRDDGQPGRRHPRHHAGTPVRYTATSASYNVGATAAGATTPTPASIPATT